MQGGGQRQELLAGASLVVLVAGQQGQRTAFAAPADRGCQIHAVVLEDIGLHVRFADQTDETPGNRAVVIQRTTDVALQLPTIEAAQLQADLTAGGAEARALAHGVDDAAGGARSVQHR
ncbi:hypothetical protein D3C71_1751110 [compost metagenome]